MDHKTQEYKTHRRRLRRITLWLRLRKKVAQQFSSLSLVAMLWTSAHNPSLSFTISWSLFKLMSIESVMPSNHLILCHPLLLLPSTLPSIRVFSNEVDFCISWPKYWSFNFSVSPSIGYSGLISFRIDWFHLPAVQWTLKESSPAPQFLRYYY